MLCPGPMIASENADEFGTKDEAIAMVHRVQEMFKKDPKLYYDNKLNTQMQKDYIKLGTAFEDGDFKRFGDGVRSI